LFVLANFVFHFLYFSLFRPALFDAVMREWSRAWYSTSHTNGVFPRSTFVPTQTHILHILPHCRELCHRPALVGLWTTPARPRASSPPIRAHTALPLGTMRSSWHLLAAAAALLAAAIVAPAQAAKGGTPGSTICTTAVDPADCVDACG
jgi:hypothetical protein